jgi:hypothetical protein
MTRNRSYHTKPVADKKMCTTVYVGLGLHMVKGKKCKVAPVLNAMKAYGGVDV